MYVSRRASKVDLRGGASIYMYVYIYIMCIYIYICTWGSQTLVLGGGASIYIYSCSQTIYIYMYICIYIYINITHVCTSLLYQPHRQQ